MNRNLPRLIPLVMLMTDVCTSQTKLDPLATIQGRVFDSETGKPLAGASVNLATLYHVFGRIPVRSARSDAQGRFTIREEPNEYYYLTATKSGYLPDDGTPAEQSFSIEAGEKRAGFVLQLIRQGIIRGRVIDADGDLVARAGVHAWQWHFAAGGRYLKEEPAGSSVRADGSFVIDHLQPGDVYLSASRGWEIANYGGAHRIDAAAPTFYPDAAGVESAKPIRITPGSEINSIELRMRRSNSYPVAGTAGGPPEGIRQATMQICAIPEPIACAGGAYLSPDGHFIIENVAAGTYELRGAAVMSGPKANGLHVRRRIEVNDALGSVAATFAALPIVSVTWREGYGSVHLQPLPWGGFGDELRHDQARVTVEPGMYRLVPTSLAEDSYLAEVRSGTEDVTGQPFEVRDAGVQLEILVKSGAARLSGSVRDTEGNTLELAPVTIWREASGRTPEFARTVVSDEDGDFEIGNLPPGEYRLAAWHGVSQGMAEYPGFFRAFSQQSITVMLAARASVEMNLTAIAEQMARRQADRVR